MASADAFSDVRSEPAPAKEAATIVAGRRAASRVPEASADALRPVRLAPLPTKPPPALTVTLPETSSAEDGLATPPTPIAPARTRLPAGRPLPPDAGARPRPRLPPVADWRNAAGSMYEGSGAPAAS